jgi:hypothetical protein
VVSRGANRLQVCSSNSWCEARGQPCSQAALLAIPNLECLYILASRCSHVHPVCQPACRFQTKFEGVVLNKQVQYQ